MSEHTNTTPTTRLLVGSFRNVYFHGSTPRNGWSSVILERDEDAFYTLYESTEDRPANAEQARREAFDGDMSTHDSLEDALIAATSYLTGGGSVLTDDTHRILHEDDVIAEYYTNTAAHRGLHGTTTTTTTEGL